MKKNKCRFSFIIPNYNEEKYIKRCLDSIFCQTFASCFYEVIVIDDGSVDRSQDIIKQYDVKLLKSNRLGAGGARNKGLGIASGEYIILLDADDYLYQKDVLEKLDKKLEDQDIVFVNYEENLGNGKRIITEDHSNTLEEQIYKSKYFCCTLKCFKKELVENIKYKEKCYHEDISFTVELMCKAKTLLYFDYIFYVYYKEDSSTTDNYTVRKALDFMTQTMEYLYFADKYVDKRQALMKRIEQEQYLLKLSKLINWVGHDNSYTYKEFLN